MNPEVKKALKKIAKQKQSMFYEKHCSKCEHIEYTPFIPHINWVCEKCKSIEEN